MSAVVQKNTDKPDAVAALRACPLFAGLSDKTHELFAAQASRRAFPKGTLLFDREEEAPWFYLIIKGWVKLFRETLGGEEAVIDILTEGHVFGETSIFGDGRYEYSAEIVEDATLVILPLPLLRRLVTEDHALALNMLDAMSRFRQQQDREIEHRNLQNTPQRIGCFLLRLCKTGGDTSVTLHLPYDKTLIAARLGMKPETFSRALAKLKEETGIAVAGATVHITSVERLSAYACSACSDVFPCGDLC